MATIQRSLSTKVNDNGKSEIMLRLSLSKNDKIRIKSGIFVLASRFKDGAFIKPRANQQEIAELRDTEDRLISLERFLIGLSETHPIKELTKDFIAKEIDRWRNPEKYAPKEVKVKKLSFDDIINEFLKQKQLSEPRERHYRVLQRALHRFELYQRLTGKESYKFSFDTCTTEDIYAFEAFLRAEPELYDQYPNIYKSYPSITHKTHKVKRPKPRGDNYMVTFTKRFKALFHWCHAQGITMNNPFAKSVSSVYEKYGTPIYIKDEEVLQLADFDFSHNKHLDTQRDIFIFQCCIGCRVGDMMKMTPANVINGGVEYIASKTAEERPETIRVPLSDRAQLIIDKHREEVKDGRLLPFISQQKYNEAIKEIFEAAGITRLVTRLNPTTGIEEQVPINTIATSHMARRTFVGNLYKKVKDQNLVGALSGHSVGSKAFARYREIDEDMKRELVNVMGY